MIEGAPATGPLLVSAATVPSSEGSSAGRGSLERGLAPSARVTNRVTVGGGAWETSGRGVKRPRLDHAAARRLADESGLALILALGMLLVLTVLFATTIEFAGSSQTHANRMDASQRA